MVYYINGLHKYMILGYNGLVNCKKGRPKKNLDMKKINYNKPRKLEESEYEELVRFRAENAYIKAEIEVIKKEIALREKKKEAAHLKAKKRKIIKELREKGYQLKYLLKAMQMAKSTYYLS